MKREKKIRFKLTKLLFICAVCYFVCTVVNQQTSINKYNSQIAMYNQEITSKQKLIQLYHEQEDNLKTDEYIEQVARESLGLVKPYEKIFVDVNK